MAPVATPATTPTAAAALPATMWFVDKLHDGLEPGREPLPADSLAALTRWYTGQGAPRDEREGVRLVQRARTYDRWLACGCLGVSVKPPLLSAAYLSEAETYYLRRLTGEGRPEHRVECPYFRPQAARGLGVVERFARPVEAPEGFFEVLKPAPEHLAQEPAADRPAPQRRPEYTPRLARLLWRLMDLAGVNVVSPPSEEPEPSIQREFGRLHRFAQTMHIAPEVRLDELLFTHPKAFHSAAVYARLRQKAQSWPIGHAPQAFVCVYATDVQKQAVRFSAGEPILVAGTLQRPSISGKAIRGPYLTIIAVGQHAEAHGYAPLRGYAQPIYGGRHFVPVDSQFERDVLAQLLRLQWRLDRDGVAVHIHKPLFDVATDLGPCRPDFVLDLLDRSTGVTATLVLEAMGAEHSEDYLAAKDITHPRMARLGALNKIYPRQLDDPARLLADLGEACLAQLR